MAPASLKAGISDSNPTRRGRTVLVSTVAFVALAALPHTPLVASLPHRGKPRNHFDMRVTERAYGDVTGVAGTDSIAIRMPNRKEVVVYPTYYHLKKGKVWPGVDEPFGYRMQDVKVGDCVGLSIYKEDRREYCVDICIVNRPGERVPPSSVEEEVYKRVAKMRYHEWRNEINDEKDFGIPRPKRD
jgi:hypothetical protein